MTKKYLGNLLIFLGVIMMIIGIICIPLENKKPIIDLPEEYPLISKDSNCPDELLGFYRNDTLFIHFKH